MAIYDCHTLQVLNIVHGMVGDTLCSKASQHADDDTLRKITDLFEAIGNTLLEEGLKEDPGYGGRFLPHTPNYDPEYTDLTAHTKERMQAISAIFHTIHQEMTNDLVKWSMVIDD